MRKYSPYVFFLGIILMIAGFIRGEYSVILNKAVNFCLECIGLG